MVIDGEMVLMVSSFFWRLLPVDTNLKLYQDSFLLRAGKGTDRSSTYNKMNYEAKNICLPYINILTQAAEP